MLKGDIGMAGRLKATLWSAAGLFVLREFRVLKIAMKFHGNSDLLHGQYGMLFRLLCLVFSWAVVWAITDIHNAEKYNLLLKQRKNRRLHRLREPWTKAPPPTQKSQKSSFSRRALSHRVDLEDGNLSKSDDTHQSPLHPDQLALEFLRQRIHKLHSDTGSLPNVVSHTSPCMSCCSTLPSEGGDLSPRNSATRKTPSPATARSFAAERLNLYLSSLDTPTHTPTVANNGRQIYFDHWQVAPIEDTARDDSARLREEVLKSSLDNFVSFNTVVLSPWSLHVVTQILFLTLICFMLSAYRVYGFASLPIAVIGCIGFINITEFLRIFKWERAKRWIVGATIVLVLEILWGKPMPKDLPFEVFMASKGNITAIILTTFWSIVTGFVLLIMGLAWALGARGTFPVSIRMFLRKRRAVTRIKLEG